MGRERLRQDPCDQHSRRVVGAAGPRAGQGGRQAERHGTDDAGTGARCGGGPWPGPSACISVFAGRVADTGRDPIPIMAAAVQMLAIYPQLELIWASPRELLNIFHADQVGCHIITVTHDLLKKLALIGKDLDEYSLDTVKMFRTDAIKAGFKLG